MKELKLSVTIDEANLILEALGTMPFKTVFGLIGKIQNQATVQLQENGTDHAAAGKQPASEVAPVAKAK